MSIRFLFCGCAAQTRLTKAPDNQLHVSLELTDRSVFISRLFHVLLLSTGYFFPSIVGCSHTNHKTDNGERSIVVIDKPDTAQNEMQANDEK